MSSVLAGARATYQRLPAILYAARRGVVHNASTGRMRCTDLDSRLPAIGTTPHGSRRPCRRTASPAPHLCARLAVSSAFSPPPGMRSCPSVRTYRHQRPNPPSLRAAARPHPCAPASARPPRGARSLRGTRPCRRPRTSSRDAPTQARPPCQAFRASSAPRPQRFAVAPETPAGSRVRSAALELASRVVSR